MKHAGGTNPIFKLDGKHVLVTAELWRELCLMGHWIHDALLVRWADLTVRLSDHGLTRETVLDALLTESDPRRETEVVRALFVGVPDLRCVWTDARLDGNAFDVDHLIPFALWRNNDLWNLLPCSPRANNAKRDSLPARALMLKRRSALSACWNLARTAHSVRFVREAAAFTGTTNPSLDDLFGALVESVEVTAVQHGVRSEDRWAG